MKSEGWNKTMSEWDLVFGSQVSEQAFLWATLKRKCEQHLLFGSPALMDLEYQRTVVFTNLMHENYNE